MFNQVIISLQNNFILFIILFINFFRSDENIKSWYSEQELLHNYAEISQANQSFAPAKQDGNSSEGIDHSFTIDAMDALEIPRSIQEQLQEQFQHEELHYLQQIKELQEEIENNKIAFDRYRERARESLLKTAGEQKNAESKLQTYKDQMKVINYFIIFF